MTPLEDKSDKETGLEEVPCLSTGMKMVVRLRVMLKYLLDVVEINSDLTGIPKRYHRVDMMGKFM
jgi:hypothetical protein